MDKVQFMICGYCGFSVESVKSKLSLGDSCPTCVNFIKKFPHQKNKAIMKEYTDEKIDAMYKLLT